jgi:hypothetical protein
VTVPPAPVAQLDVEGAGKLLLQSVIQQLEALEVDLPDRVGLTPGGLIAYDGEQLTVTLMNIALGQPDKPVSGYVNPGTVQQYYEWEVNLLRATRSLDDDGQPPTARKLTSEFGRFARDMASLWAAMVAIHYNYMIVPNGVPFLYGPATTVGPQGNLAGVRCPVAWACAQTKPTPGPS